MFKNLYPAFVIHYRMWLFNTDFKTLKSEEKQNMIHFFSSFAALALQKHCNLFNYIHVSTILQSCQFCFSRYLKPMCFVKTDRPYHHDKGLTPSYNDVQIIFLKDTFTLQILTCVIQ